MEASKEDKEPLEFFEDCRKRLESLAKKFDSCVFCGGRPRLRQWGEASIAKKRDFYWLQCTNCEHRSPRCKFEDLHLIWNKKFYKTRKYARRGWGVSRKQTTSREEGK